MNFRRESSSIDSLSLRRESSSLDAVPISARPATAQARPKVFRHPHPLLLGSNLIGWEGPFPCDVCGDLIHLKTLAYTCVDCRHDECANCYYNSASVCTPKPHQHPVELNPKVGHWCSYCRRVEPGYLFIYLFI